MRILLLLLAWIAPAAGQSIKSEEHTFRVVKVVEGLDHPWSVAFLPDGRMLVTEKAGRLHIVGKDGTLSEPLADEVAGRLAEMITVLQPIVERERDNVSPELERAREPKKTPRFHRKRPRRTAAGM